MKLLLESWRQYLDEDVGGFTAEYQLFIPRACDDETCAPAKLSSTPPVENRERVNKPYGGFWTSTAKKEKEWTSEWNEWMKYDMPHWMHPQGILLKPKTSNVFHIENDDDAKLLHEEFPLKTTGASVSFSAFSGPSEYTIDFEAALQKYDGIHWGMKSGADSDSWDFGRSGMWDMESTVWRDASVLEVVEVVSVSQVEERGVAEGKKRK
jgi:hypothetical protein